MIKLDFTSFEKVINSFESIINRYEAENHDIDIRDAVIQRFEYTYSLAIKMMKRFIDIQMPEITTDLTFNEIIRQANKFGLLKSNLEKWSQYRQKRNLTSHTYDEKAAKEVISIVFEFLNEAKFLLKQLKK